LSIDSLIRGPTSSGVVIEDLTESECRARLSMHQVGRIAISIHALPVILPVNYSMEGDRIVFRSTPGTKLSAALTRSVIAFEIDAYEPNADQGWSVVVQGVVETVTDEKQVEALRRLPLRPISPGGVPDHFVRLTTQVVTGRCVRPRTSFER
jgi:uncharacterized protein